MRAAFIIILIWIINFNSFCQSKIEDDLEYAFQNAKKGVYWALGNIPDKKSKIVNDLIADDKLYSAVKLYKAVDGVKIEATGYYNTNEVTIKIFRSNESLENDGYLKKEDPGVSNKIKKRKD
ncbi:MAG TPA: hypothetical protein VMT35_06935 [Ignavibacteriaceae bacterium]|nr:hypothetical protein [Ignavibacteriaceae bacterium]